MELSFVANTGEKSFTVHCSFADTAITIVTAGVTIVTAGDR